MALAEMADADYGYVGARVNKEVSLYRKQVCVENIPQEVAVEHLLALQINNDQNKINNYGTKNKTILPMHIGMMVRKRSIAVVAKVELMLLKISLRLQHNFGAVDPI